MNKTHRQFNKQQNNENTKQTLRSHRWKLDFQCWKVDIHRWARPRTSPYDKHLGALQDEPAGIVGLTEPEQEAFDGVSLEDLLEGRGLLPGDVLEPLTD